MVEYGQSNVVSNKKERTPPTMFFGIRFGEISYLDYEPNTKLKVEESTAGANVKIKIRKLEKISDTVSKPVVIGEVQKNVKMNSSLKNGN